AQADVLAINYENGEKETFQSAAQQEVAASKVEFHALNQDSILLLNREYIKRLNGDRIEFINDEAKAKKKDAQYFLCQYNFDDTSIFNDGFVEVKYEWGFAKYDGKGNLKEIANEHRFCLSAFRPVVKNLTDKVIYIDLGNTFFKENDNATPYYLPTVTSVSGTNTTGGSVNVGAITGALGIGGAVGTLANGVNVGGSSANSTQTVTYSQRIISVPPHSIVNLEWKPFLPEQKRYVTHSTSKLERDYYTNYSLSLLYLRSPKSDNFYEGTVKEFDLYNTPHKGGLYLSYSLDDGFSSSKAIEQTFYIVQLIGNSNPWWKFTNHTNNFGEIEKGIWGYIKRQD
ncbi:MAG: hypothetical protein LIO90_11110, partial [Bacteroidales bacterium]|nr:hypothetical protein [Bacteroidales bacterium]